MWVRFYQSIQTTFICDYFKYPFDTMISIRVAPFRINPMIGPYPDGLDYWGAKNSFKILKDNEKYRLITPILLHGGVIHLLSNIFVQLDACAFWEKEWGSSCWLVLYLASGLGSSIMSVMFKPNNISVGSRYDEWSNLISGSIHLQSHGFLNILVERLWAYSVPNWQK